MWKKWMIQGPKWKEWIGLTNAKPCQPGAGEGVEGVVESHKLKLKTAVHANYTLDRNVMHRLTDGSGAVGAPLSSPATAAAKTSRCLPDTQDMRLHRSAGAPKLCRGRRSGRSRRRSRRSSRVLEVESKDTAPCAN